MLGFIVRPGTRQGTVQYQQHPLARTILYLPRLRADDLAVPPCEASTRSLAPERCRDPAIRPVTSSGAARTSTGSTLSRGQCTIQAEDLAVPSREVETWRLAHGIRPGAERNSIDPWLRTMSRDHTLDRAGRGEEQYRQHPLARSAHEPGFCCALSRGPERNSIDSALFCEDDAAPRLHAEDLAVEIRSLAPEQ